MKKTTLTFWGFLIGITNIMLGAGGGMLAVPLLKKCGINQKEAQATAVAIILPLSIISLIIYFLKGNVKLNDYSQLFILILGATGSFLGVFLIKKISNIWLKRIFSIFLLWAGIRMMTK